MTKQKFNSQKLSRVLVWLFCLTVVIAAVFMTVETVTSGVEMATLTTEGNQLLLQKRSYSEQLVKTSSLNDLNKIASDLGFGKTQKIIYLNQEKEEVAVKFP